MVRQLSLDAMLREVKPRPDGRAWLVVSGDENEAQAIERYRERFGAPPQMVRRGKPDGAWWLGPVPERGEAGDESLRNI